MIDEKDIKLLIKLFLENSKETNSKIYIHPEVKNLVKLLESEEQNEV